MRVSDLLQGESTSTSRRYCGSYRSAMGGALGLGLAKVTKRSLWYVAAIFHPPDFGDRVAKARLPKKKSLSKPRVGVGQS
jgi:hypothetical protein